MSGEKLVRLLAFYFPQFHAIPENDEWWGKGFTDWVNVRRAQPQFSGHYQPRVPAGGRYYDQSQKETLAWQIDLARSHGISGFCHYHYWFDGKQLLQTPTNIVLDSPELDLPLCLAWANETWSRRWDGRDHHILQEQTHRPDRALWAQHFEYLFRAWSDPRAITVDGKPMFLVYRAHRIQQIGEMFDFWREEAHRRGLPGIYLVSMKQYEFPVPEVLRHFDATMQFQPFEAIYSPDYEGTVLETSKPVAALRLLPEKVQDLLRALRYRFLSGLTFYDYDMVWKQILKEEREGGIPAFPGAFVDWDNTAALREARAHLQGGIAGAAHLGVGHVPGPRRALRRRLPGCREARCIEGQPALRCTDPARRSFGVRRGAPGTTLSCLHRRLDRPYRPLPPGPAAERFGGFPRVLTEGRSSPHVNSADGSPREPVKKGPGNLHDSPA